MTGIEITKKQLGELNSALKNNEFKKVSSEIKKINSDNWKNNKTKYIKEWETNTNQKWPTYKEDGFYGKKFYKKGQNYEGHHIIQ